MGARSHPPGPLRPLLLPFTVVVLLLAATKTSITAAADSTPTPGHGDAAATAAAAAVPGNRPGDDHFLYFAYGSNLLARRLHLLNPTARRHGIAQLKDYRLDFSTPASRSWGGAPATVVPEAGASVWGAVWALDIADRDNLDRQESVHTGLYDVFNATVLTPGGETLHCRCYLMRVVPGKVADGEPLPAERRPSLVYKRVIVTGARESGLPDEYVARVEAVADNGSAGVDPPVSLDSLPRAGKASDSPAAPPSAAPAPAAR